MAHDAQYPLQPFGDEFLPVYYHQQQQLSPVPYQHPYYLPDTEVTSGPRPAPMGTENVELLAFADVLLRHSSSDSVKERGEEEEDEDEPSPTPPSRPASQPEKRARPAVMADRPSSTIGENRLKINFLDFGVPLVPGSALQVFGADREGIIPHGVCGTTEVYTEQWMFRIYHVRPDGYSRTVVQFVVHNLASSHVTSRVETEQEAKIREEHARTICNQVLREALETRAKQLEEELESAMVENRIRVANLQGRIRSLRPRRLLIGLLFFGLQHRALQERMQALLEQMEAQG